MSQSFRVRGQEVQVRLVKNKQLMTTLTEIKSCEATFKFDILSESYLGKTSESKDDIYKSSAGQLVFHPRSADSLTLITTLRERASRRIAQTDLVINLVFVLSMPNGQRPIITIPDLKFSDIPIRAGGREEYVEQTLAFEAETFDITL